MNRRIVRLVSLILTCTALLFAVSCDMEVESFGPHTFVKSADCIVWRDGAASESDTAKKGLAKNELKIGTDEESFKEVIFKLNLIEFKGYDLVFLDFNIISNHDVAVTVEALSGASEDGKRTSYGEQTFNLVAGEQTEISLDLNYKVKSIFADAFIFVTFATELPFAPEVTESQETEEMTSEETLEGTEEVEQPLYISDVKYVIKQAHIYGVQTTAT